MGIFDFFKKKEEREYDPTNVRVTHLRENFMLDYDMKTWQVKEMYEYDWGENYFSWEYKLDSGDDIVFLSVEEDDELELVVSRKIKLGLIDEDVEEAILDTGKPPKRVTYKGTQFIRENESPGFFRNAQEHWDNATEFICWNYYDESEKLNLCIERWGEEEFEAAVGVVVEEFQFSNILPA